MKFRWSIAPPQPLLAGQMAREMKVSPLLAQCLLNRGITGQTCAAEFLQPKLKHLSDPFLLPEMRAAVDRIFLAREREESVVVFGDYDVDGVTSTTLLVEVLGGLGWKVSWYLPHRLDEGYGLSLDAAANCLRKFPCSLLLAADCASTAFDSITALKEQGVDVIVLDHHQVSDPKPPAVALVNPQVQSLAGAFRELCSVGLSFKLAHALLKRGREIGLPGADTFNLKPLLDLVALGTIADIVPLTGENRILVSAGLERLNQTQRPGLVALKQAANSPAHLGTFEVGFQLAPRLNAAGRLETAEHTMKLLLAPTLADALPLALELDRKNRERQQIERAIAEEAVEAVRARFDPNRDFVIVEGRETWHIGVVGIVASRVLQQFYRPTIIVGGDGEAWRGSGRSVPGLDLAAALRECGDLLVRHGGHAMAAGVTLKPGNIDEFRARLNEVAKRFLKPDDLQPSLRLDAQVGLEEIGLECVGALDRLRPMGQGNPTVQFCAAGISHQRPLQRIGSDKQHVKMWVTDGLGHHEAVWWSAGNLPLPVGTFDLAFAPTINDYNGRRAVQLKVLDWRPAAAPSLL